MSARLRKLIGLPILLAFLAAWVVGATMLADRLPDNKLVELAFYVVAGVFWWIPLTPLFRWMNRGR